MGVKGSCTWKMRVSENGSPTMKSRPMKYASAPFRSVGPTSNVMFRAGVIQYNAESGGLGRGVTPNFWVASNRMDKFSVSNGLWLVRCGYFR